MCIGRRAGTPPHGSANNNTQQQHLRLGTLGKRWDDATWLGNPHLFLEKKFNRRRQTAHNRTLLTKKNHKAALPKKGVVHPPTTERKCTLFLKVLIVKVNILATKEAAGVNYLPFQPSFSKKAGSEKKGEKDGKLLLLLLFSLTYRKRSRRAALGFCWFTDLTKHAHIPTSLPALFVYVTQRP